MVWLGAEAREPIVGWVSWPAWVLLRVPEPCAVDSPGSVSGFPGVLAAGVCLLKNSDKGGEAAMGAPLHAFCKVAVAMGLP